MQSRQAGRPTSRPAGRPAGRPADRPTDQPTPGPRRPTGRPAGRPTSRPVGRSAGRLGGVRSTDRLGGGPADRPAGRPAPWPGLQPHPCGRRMRTVSPRSGHSGWQGERADSAVNGSRPSLTASDSVRMPAFPGGRNGKPYRTCEKRKQTNQHNKSSIFMNLDSPAKNTHIQVARTPTALPSNHTSFLVSPSQQICSKEPTTTAIPAPSSILKPLLCQMHPK